MHVSMMPDYRKDNPYQQLLANALNEHGVKVHFPFGYKRIFPIFRNMGECDNLHLHWLDPFLGHSHNIFIKTIYTLKFFIDIILVKLSGKQITWTVHNLISHDSEFYSLQLITYRFMAYLANSIIVHSQSTIEPVCKMYKINDNNKVHVIAHGHYKDAYPPSIPKEQAYQKLKISTFSGKTYLFFGMIRPYKGLENLILQWNNFNHDGNNLLIIAGNGSKEYLDTLRALTLHSPNIRLDLRFIEDSEIPHYFSSADFVVLPFKQMLTSGSLLLALSYEKPVIAPATPFIVETLCHADQLLYNETQPDALFQSLLLSQEVNSQDFIKPLRDIMAQLDWNPIAILTARSYEKDDV